MLKIMLFLFSYHLLSLRLQLHTSGESDLYRLTEHHVLPVKATDFTTHSFWTPATKAWPKGSPGYLVSKLNSVRLHSARKNSLPGGLKIQAGISMNVLPFQACITDMSPIMFHQIQVKKSVSSPQKKTRTNFQNDKSSLSKLPFGV